MPDITQDTVSMTIAAHPRFPSAASRSSISISDEGLKIGLDLILLRMAQGRLALAEDGGRCLVLLSVLAKRSVSANALLDVVAAAAHLRNGDKALANLRLAFARIPLVAAADDHVRLLAADLLLDEGFSPHRLMRELGLATMELDRLSKYDENQPRVPAGNGRPSGQWGSSGSGAGKYALVTAAAASRGFLAGAAPDIVAALGRFALRFSMPAVVLGALLIPTPNSGGVTEGTLSEADIGFHFDGPAGKLVLTIRGATVVARVQAGLLVDTRTGQQIGRNLGGHLYIALDLVHELTTQTQRDSEYNEEKPKVAIDEEEPQLCPAPQKDVPHGAPKAAKDYEEDVHQRVNPIAPLDAGLGVRFTNPVTGNSYAFDDCFRYSGDLIDGDMKTGDMVDAKGPGYLDKLRKPALRDFILNDLKRKADRQQDAVRGTGRRIKWYFAEREAGIIVRDNLHRPGIVFGHMPPKRR